MDAKNGMMTKVWGPAGWFFLHSVTFGFPHEITEENKTRRRDYINFFNSLGNVLPCKYCRESWNNFMKDLPIEEHVESRETITKWLYDMHNKVNYKLGVPDCDIPTFEEVVNRFEQYRAKCKQTTEKERQEKLVKGCTIPQNGIKQRCVINVVKEYQGEDRILNTDTVLIILSLCTLFLGLMIVLKKSKN
jgi:hypothetical protein